MQTKSKQIKAFDVALAEIEKQIEAIGPHAYRDEDNNARYNDLREARHVLEAFRNALVVTA